MPRLNTDTKPKWLRIENDRQTGEWTKVVYEDGSPDGVDISGCITGINLKLKVGEINTATLEVLITGGRIRAELEDLIINDLGKELRHHGWRRRLVDVTTFGSRARQWLLG